MSRLAQMHEVRLYHTNTTPNAILPYRSIADHLNLLTITAMISITNTVMIATVTILLVAILGNLSADCTCLELSPKTGQVPSRHSS